MSEELAKALGRVEGKIDEGFRNQKEFIQAVNRKLDNHMNEEDAHPKMMRRAADGKVNLFNAAVGAGVLLVGLVEAWRTWGHR